MLQFVNNDAPELESYTETMLYLHCVSKKFPPLNSL